MIGYPAITSGQSLHLASQPRPPTACLTVCLPRTCIGAKAQGFTFRINDPLLIRSLVMPLCSPLRLASNPFSGKDSRQAGMTGYMVLLMTL